MVLLEDQDKPRGFWKLARVEKLLVGKDNKVRGAQVRVSAPKPCTLRRPVQALYPLEVHYPVEEIADDPETPPEDPASREGEGTELLPTERPSPRPSLGSANRAKRQFKRWAVDLSEDFDR